MPEPNNDEAIANESDQQRDPKKARGLSNRGVFCVVKLFSNYLGPKQKAFFARVLSPLRLAKRRIVTRSNDRQFKALSFVRIQAIDWANSLSRLGIARIFFLESFSPPSKKGKGNCSVEREIVNGSALHIASNKNIFFPPRALRKQVFRLGIGDCHEAN